MLNLKKIGGFKVFPNGYRVSVWLVRVLCVCLVAYLVFVMSVFLSNERFFLENDSPFFVENPFFGSELKSIPFEISSMKELPPGFVAGFDAPWWAESASVIALALLLVGVFVNHFCFNKRGDLIRYRFLYGGVD